VDGILNMFARGRHSFEYACSMSYAIAIASLTHWHDKRFTPWHAIWRSSEGITRDSVRGDARHVK